MEPVTTVLTLGGLALGGYFLAKRKQRRPYEDDDGPELPPRGESGLQLAGPPGTPEAIYELRAYKAAFRFFDTQSAANQLVQTRYWTAEATVIVGKTLNIAQAFEHQTIPGPSGGSWYIFEIHPAPNGGGAGAYTAMQTATTFASQGYAIAVSINLLFGISGQKGRVFMAAIPMQDRWMFGRTGEQYAVLMHKPDPIVEEQIRRAGNVGVPSQQPAPQQQQQPAPQQQQPAPAPAPYYPAPAPAPQQQQQPAPQQQQPAPMHPYAFALDPGLTPYALEGINYLLTNERSPSVLEMAAMTCEAQGYRNAAGALRRKAGDMRAQQPAPQIPVPGQQTPGQPAPPPQPIDDGLDAKMPAELRKDVLLFLAEEDNPEVLETLARSLEDKYPKAAKTVRAKAALLRERVEMQDAQRGGMPFRIRSGDIASRVAQWYTGTPSGSFDGDSNRWRELLPINPSLKSTAQGLTGWDVGKEVLLPISWHARRKAFPPVATKALVAKPNNAATVPANTPQTPTTTAPLSPDAELALSAVNIAQEAVDAIGEKSDQFPDDEKLSGLLSTAEASAAASKEKYNAGDFKGALAESARAAAASTTAQNYTPPAAENASVALKVPARKRKART